MPRPAGDFLRRGTQNQQANEVCATSGMSTDRIGVGFGSRLHALAGSGSRTLQYFFGGKVFFVGSNCPNVSEWIL